MTPQSLGDLRARVEEHLSAGSAPSSALVAAELALAAALVVEAEGRPGDREPLDEARVLAAHGLEVARATSDIHKAGWANEIIARAASLLSDPATEEAKYVAAFELYEFGMLWRDAARVLIKRATSKFTRDTEGAGQLFLEARDLLRSHGLSADPLDAAISHNLGALAEQVGDLEGASALLREALGAPLDQRVERTTLRVLARVERGRGKLADAEVFFGRALALHGCPPRDEPERLRCVLGLATTRRAQGREVEAQRLIADTVSDALAADWPLYDLAGAALRELPSILEEEIRARLVALVAVARDVGAPADLVHALESRTER